MLSESEYKLIKRALRFCAEGPLFPEWEFQTLFGLSRNEVLSLSEFNSQAVISPELALAISGAINNLLHYPHGKLLLVQSQVAPSEQLEKLSQAWSALNPPA